MLCLMLSANVLYAASDAFAGRRVSDVLESLRAEGLTFIYNTRLVPDRLLVDTEPAARSGVQLAEEILQQHGLTLSKVAEGTFAVVRRRAAGRTAPPSSPRAAAPIEEVVVQTSRYLLASPEAPSHAFLTQEQVQNLPRLADETLQAVQRLPGMAVNGFSSLGSVRGGAPNETAILVDGLRLYEPFHLKNFLSPVSLLDSRLIGGLDVYSGGFPASYGDRMSAIIDAQSVRPEKPRYYELGLSMFHVNGLASSAFAGERGRALISGRRSNLDQLAKLSEHDFGEPTYSDGFVRLDYSISEATQLSFDALLSADRVTANTDGGTQRASATYDNRYAWLALDHAWTSDASTRVIASYTDVTNGRKGTVDDPGRRTGSVVDNRSFHVAGLRIDTDLRTDAVDHTFGMEARKLSAHYSYWSDVRFEPGFPFADSPGLSLQRALAPQPHGFEASAYWSGRLALGRRWTVDAGLRVDTQTYDGSDDAEQWSPRFGILYDVGEGTRWRLSWGRFFQGQAINELQVEDGVDRFYPAQHADHAIASFEHTLGKAVDLRVEVYRKDYGDLMPRFENLFNPLALLPEVEFDRVRIDPAGARAEGIELLLVLRPVEIAADGALGFVHGVWSGWFSYSWSRARDYIDSAAVPRSWDQKHAVSVGLAWDNGPWAVTVADSYHSGWPTTPLALVDGRAVAGARNSKRFGAYNSLDFRVTRTLTLPRGELDVFIETSNALSRHNPCCTEYSVASDASGAPVLRAEQEYWLPRVPSIGVLWRY